MQVFAPPGILSASVEPQKVRPGDTMLVSAHVSDQFGIMKEVTADMGGIETIKLDHAGKGLWQATWKVHSTGPRDYTTTIKATNLFGLLSFAKVEWSDPPATITVCAIGCNSLTIQGGIDTASAGDNVYVYNGTYTEQVYVNKTVNLTAQNVLNTTVLGGFNVTANGVTIQNFNISGGYSYTSASMAGIYITGNNTLVFNNTINNITGGTDGTAVGIYLSSSANNTLTSNNITSLTGGAGGSGGTGTGGSPSGIYLSSSTNNTISSNNITNLTGGTGGPGGPGGGGGSFSEGTASLKSLAFSFQAATPVLKILASVLYTLTGPQDITVSYPSSIPPSVPPIPGLAYSFLEIAPAFNSSRYLSQAQIDFRVNKTWYSKNDIAPGSTALLRYDGQSWRSLPTVRTGEDLVTYQFQSNTTSFSLFAITGAKMQKTAPTSATVLPTATTIAPAVPTPTTWAPASTPAIQPPSKSATPAILLLLIVSAMFLYGHYRSKPMRSSSDEVKRPAFFPSKPKPPPSGVTLKGIVTSHVRGNFEVFDGTKLIAVRFPGRKPRLGSRVLVVGTYHNNEYFSATSVEET